MTADNNINTILIVDDTPKNIQVLGNILKDNNYKVLAATNGKDALVSIEKRMPDLILLDIMMPEMDGYEVCTKIKENAKTKHLPIIFLTAKTESEDIVKGFELGAVDYITKPFQSTELLSRVKTQLTLKNRGDALEKISEERKELVHVLCHDLTNPIGFIQGVLEMSDDDPAVLQEMKHHIETSVKDSLQIIDMVRKMMAIDENQIELETSPNNLLDLVNESLSILKSKMAEKEITVNVDIDNKLDVKVDRITFVNSVINNLLTNAIKFSFPGSEINISASLKGKEVNLQIKDHGIGMSEQLQANLFDIKKTTSRKGTAGESGSGFGMPMVQKLVAMYEGKIVISSKEKDKSPDDYGTTIEIVLPGSSE